MLLACNDLWHIGFIVGPPPEPKVVGSTPASRTSLRFGFTLRKLSEMRGSPLVRRSIGSGHVG